MRALLSFAGRKGPYLLFVGVVAGLLWPEAARAAHPLMGVAVFVFTLGAFLKVNRVDFERELARPRQLAAVLGWTLAGVPLLAWMLTRAVPLPAGVGVGLLLCMAAPPVGSAAAIAAMLGLNPALALVGTVVVSLLAPLYLPALSTLTGGVSLQIDGLALMGRLCLVVIGSAATAAALRWTVPRWLDENPEAMTGASVSGLLVVALGAMHGMQPIVLAHAADAGVVLGIAFAVNVTFQIAGALLFRHLGATDALSVGLISGNRNVTLVMVAAGPWLGHAPEVQLYLVASVFPIFMLPLLTARVLAWRPALRRGIA